MNKKFSMEQFRNMLPLNSFQKHCELNRCFKTFGKAILNSTLIFTFSFPHLEFHIEQDFLLVVGKVIDSRSMIILLLPLYIDDR